MPKPRFNRPADHPSVRQGNRLPPPLDPAYAPVDERTLRDFLRFVHDLAQKLPFPVAEGEPGTWANLLGPEPNFEQIAALLENPETAPEKDVVRYGRPHVALLLAFLKLQQLAQTQLNTLTRRHLHYYYEDVLRFKHRDRVPDRVNVIVKPAPHVSAVELPAGTLLDAGIDGDGIPLHYATDQTVVFGHARVNEIRSLFVDRLVIGIPDVHRYTDMPPAQRFRLMLKIALGDPEPGAAVVLPDDLALPDSLKDPDDKLQAVIERMPEYLQNHAERIEKIFCMSADEMAFILSVRDKPIDEARADWEQVHTILAEAHVQKVYARRRDKLRQVYDDARARLKADDRAAAGKPAATPLTAVWQAASGSDLPEYAFVSLLPFVADEADAAFLRQVEHPANQGENLTAAEWDRFFRVVELAQRAKEELPRPVARFIRRLNLLPSLDATTRTVATVAEDSVTADHWRTFGSNTPTDDEARPVPPSIGWAISSPLLALAEGKRDVVITLDLASASFAPDKIDWKAFQIEVSTAAGFVALPVKKPDDTSGHSLEADRAAAARLHVRHDDLLPVAGEAEPDAAAANTARQVRLQVEIYLDPAFAPLAPLPAVGRIPPPPHPVVRLRLQPEWGDRERLGYRWSTCMDALEDLKLAHVHLHVTAAELLPRELRGDDGTLNPKRPFDPFGSQAVSGSRLWIYHPEIVSRALASLTFTVAWQGVPDKNLAAYYRHYPIDDGALTNESFGVTVSLIDHEEAYPQHDAAVQPLFQKADATGDMQLVIPVTEPARQAMALPIRPGEETLRAWQWTLGPVDFQHHVYPGLALQKAAELSHAIATKENLKAAEAYHINPPYTPKIKHLTLAYTAETDFRIDQYGPGTNARVYHVEPFGYREIQPDGQHTIPFLPDYPHEGELLIGLSGVLPPQTVTLLFQLVEDSADPDLERFPLSWSYLSGNRWLSLDDGGLVYDRTRQLLHAGILAFSLPPAEPGTLLPPDRYWLRCTIDENSRSVADTIAIHAGAVGATLIDNGNALDHFARPLPAETITDLVQRQPAITAVYQPYTSFGGKLPEADAQFYTRISERLRHKDRALTVWDYERLILEQFPDVYSVKCLPAQPDKPGQVHVVVIPDIRKKRPARPFAPQVSADTLAEITDFLVARAPAAARVKVTNPVYVPVEVRVAVRLLPGYSPGFYQARLVEDVQRFLAPWAFDDKAEIVIGKRIYANSIVNYLEERPYVDFVAHVRLFKDEYGDGMRLVWPPRRAGYFVAPTRPDEVLTSAPSHDIDLIWDDDYRDEAFTGIGYMRIELDFIVDGEDWRDTGE